MQGREGRGLGFVREALDRWASASEGLDQGGGDIAVS